MEELLLSLSSFIGGISAPTFCFTSSFYYRTASISAFFLMRLVCAFSSCSCYRACYRYWSCSASSRSRRSFSSFSSIMVLLLLTIAGSTGGTSTLIGGTEACADCESLYSFAISTYSTHFWCSCWRISTAFSFTISSLMASCSCCLRGSLSLPLASCPSSTFLFFYIYY